MKVKNKKAFLRKEINEKIYSAEGRQIIKRSILMQEAKAYCADFLYRIPGYKEAKTVFAYHALKDEFPTEGLLKQILKDGKKLALPVVESADLVFKEVYLKNLEIAPLKKGAYGIFEPADECKTLFSKETMLTDILPLLIITPGKAFSKNGNRLGHGGGYYDRFFHKLFESADKTKIFTAGICFSFQIIDNIPSEEFDIPVQNVFTEIIKKSS